MLLGHSQRGTEWAKANQYKVGLEKALRGGWSSGRARRRKKPVEPIEEPRIKGSPSYD